MWTFSLKREEQRGKGRPQRAAAQASSRAMALGASIFICHQHRKETPSGALALASDERSCAQPGNENGCWPGEKPGEGGRDGCRR